MASIASRRNCLTCPDSFCYICCSFTTPNQRSNICEFVRELNFATLKWNLGIKTNHGNRIRYVIHAKKSCVNGLIERTKWQSAFWWYGVSHQTMSQILTVAGFTSQTRHLISYPSLDSATRHLPDSNEPKNQRQTLDSKGMAS